MCYNIEGKMNHKKMKRSIIPPQGVEKNKMTSDEMLSLITGNHLPAIKICKTWFKVNEDSSAEYYLHQLDYWGIYGESICKFADLCNNDYHQMTKLIFALGEISEVEPGVQRINIIEAFQKAVDNSGQGISLMVGKGFKISNEQILDVKKIVEKYDSIFGK